MKAFLLGISIGIGLLGLTVLVVYLYLRRSLPRTRGHIHLHGTRGTIDILRDKAAIPHIYAEQKLDAFFGLGYVHAQDRLWQMEFMRRIGQGRLAEIFGKSSLNTDIFLRTLGMQRAAASAWEELAPDIRAIVDAYIAGINSVIHGNRTHKLPPEFSLLRLKPEAWTGPQIMVMNKVMAWQLSGNFDTELLRSQFIQAVGKERASQILAPYPVNGPSIVTWPVPNLRQTPDMESTPTIASTADGYQQLSELEQATRRVAGEGARFKDVLGSDSWVVDGSMSVTGKPLLANDPHLGVEIPLTWYLAHLSAPELDVIGATIPGSPAVVIGRNAKITWGLTNLNPDVQDLFREHIDPTGKQAEYQEQWEDMHIYDEIIQVKGEAAITCQVRITRHGPLISDALNETAARRNSSSTQEALEPLALRWTALDKQDSTLEAFIRINEAHNWQTFKDAVRLFVAPGQNFLYADTEGNIGYQASGNIPLRASGDGSTPGEGWSGHNDWLGYVPFEELPSNYNPPEHYIVAANQRPASPDYPHFLGREWSSTYRAERISELLQSKDTFSAQDFIAMQADTISKHAQELLPHILPLVKPQDSFAHSALELLSTWDKNMAGESAAAALYGAWFRLLPRAVLKDELDIDLIANYEWRFQFVGRFITQTFASYRQEEQSAEASIDCAAIANQTFHQAVADVKHRLGGDPQRWRWSKLHHLMLVHQPLGRNKYLGFFLNRKIESQGDCGTLNYAPISYEPAYQQIGAAGYRQIVDLANPEQSLFMHLAGQSGHFLSPHYADYLSAWKRMNYHCMRTEHKVIKKECVDLLRIHASH